MSRPPAPVTHPARRVLEDIDAKLEYVHHLSPSNTREGLWLNARLETLRELRRLLAESLPDIEVESVIRAMPGTTADVARILLGVGEPVDDETLVPLPWAVSA